MYALRTYGSSGGMRGKLVREYRGHHRRHHHRRNAAEDQASFVSEHTAHIISDDESRSHL